jgi:putative membrane protein insertion efficiency factor
MTGALVSRAPAVPGVSIPAALTFVMLLPRNACVLILRGYRAVISPLYGDVCRYYPSCSAYTLTAIQQHGVIKGVGLGAWRIARCHPWAKGGVDDVPLPRAPRYQITRFGLVVAQPRKELTHA